MPIIDNSVILELNHNYEVFCKSIEFREGEDFYVENPSVFELSYNENPLGPGRFAVDCLGRLAAFAHRYPPLGYSILVDKLADNLGLLRENLLITPGSVAAIHLAITAFADERNGVIFSKASLPWYRWATLGNHSTPEIVPLKKDMHHDLEAMLSRITTETRVIILANPNNPTGLYIDENCLKDFHSQIPEDVILIVDQAYYEYQSNQEKSLIGMVNDVPNLLLTRTFSKIHGLAGMRVGYAIGNKEVIQATKSKWLGFMPSVTSLSCFAAYHALSDEDHIVQSRDFNNDTKHALSNLFNEYSLHCLGGDANFVAINIQDSKKYEHLFKEQNMAYSAGWHFGYPDWARISFDKRTEIMLEKLNSIFKKL